MRYSIIAAAIRVVNYLKANDKPVASIDVADPKLIGILTSYFSENGTKEDGTSLIRKEVTDLLIHELSDAVAFIVSIIELLCEPYMGRAGRLYLATLLIDTDLVSYDVLKKFTNKSSLCVGKHCKRSEGIFDYHTKSISFIPNSSTVFDIINGSSSSAHYAASVISYIRDHVRSIDLSPGSSRNYEAIHMISQFNRDLNVIAGGKHKYDVELFSDAILLDRAYGVDEILKTSEGYRSLSALPSSGKSLQISAIDELEDLFSRRLS